MDSFFGVKLDNVLIESGYTHDKVCADLIVNDKKVGEIINDGWCESYFIEFFDSRDEDAFEDQIYTLYEEHKIKSTQYDDFIEMILFMAKKYKSIKNKKNNNEQFTFI